VEHILGQEFREVVHALTPKDPWVGAKPLKTTPSGKKTCNYFFDKYFSRSNCTIKYKTYIRTIVRSFIFYFISTWDIITLKVAVFFFFELAQRAYFLFNLGL
jgi:hypothetical protein